jgi:response regulator of citrate/malate metabolism
MSTPRTDNHTFRLLGRELPMPSLIAEARRMEQELAELRNPVGYRPSKIGRPSIAKHIADKIRALPAEVSAAEAAAKLGVSQTTINRYRRGK